MSARTQSNWASLKVKLRVQCSAPQEIQTVTEVRTKKRKRTITQALAAGHKLGADGKAEKERFTRSGKRRGTLTDIHDFLSLEQRASYVGLDCEMVGIGPSGRKSALARCCIVNFDGDIIYDKFVKPKEFVTDFRTEVSGISIKEIKLRDAITPAQCAREVAELVKGKTIVGHSLVNDLKALMLTHPKDLIRDTARYKLKRVSGHFHDTVRSFKPYMRASGASGMDIRPRKLKEIAKQFLGMDIQQGEHDPGEDARAAMLLYRLKREEWERDLASLSKTKRCKTSRSRSTKPQQKQHEELEEG